MLNGEHTEGVCSPETKTIKTIKKIAYIIGHRSSDEYRVKNLILVTEWLLKVKEKLQNIQLDIIVVEQNTTPTVDKILNPQVNYILAYNSGFYNRGWGFNVAFRKFEADYYFFADNDIVMSIKDAISIFTSCFEYEAVNPYKNIFDTLETIHTPNNILNTFYNGKDIEDTYIKGKRSRICFSGGIVGLSKQSMHIVSGWDERFRGRGYEDYAMTSKMKLFLNSSMYTYSFNAIHLYHPSETNTSRIDNEKLNHEYQRYIPQDYANIIINTSETFGSITKYKNESEEESKNNIINERFLFSLDKDIFFKRFLKANDIYKSLKILVIQKHNDNDTNNIERLIYENLCEQHECHLHKCCEKKDCDCNYSCNQESEC